MQFTTAILTTLALVGTSVNAAPADAKAAVAPAADLQTVALFAHNYRRRGLGAGIRDLVWEEMLAKSAEVHVKKCLGNTPSNVKGLGENIAHSKNPNAGGMIAYQWSKEANYGDYMDTVWAATEKVGCATNKCGGETWLVCQYWPMRT